jgi:hypothetical protein
MKIPFPEQEAMLLRRFHAKVTFCTKICLFLHKHAFFVLRPPVALGKDS